jgi:hypothetical protein
MYTLSSNLRSAEETSTGRAPNGGSTITASCYKHIKNNNIKSATE